MFLGPDKHLQVCKCPVEVWSLISKDHLSSHQGSYMLWQQMSPKWNQIQPDRVWGKAIRDKSAFCAGGYMGQKGTFDSVFNLKYLFRQWNLNGPLISYYGPLILCHSALAPYKLYVGPWGAIWAMLRATALHQATDIFKKTQMICKND